MNETQELEEAERDFVEPSLAELGRNSVIFIEVMVIILLIIHYLI